MERKIFVFVTRDVVFINSENNNKTISFEALGIRQNSPKIIVNVICDYLQSSGLSSHKMILVLGEEYLSVSEKISSGTKRNQSNIPKNILKQNILKNDKKSDSLILTEVTDYINHGKIYSDFNELPLLQKFFKRSLVCSFESNDLREMLTLLLEKGVELESILPLSNFLIKNQNSQIAISLNKNTSYISLIKNGVIRKTISFPFGVNRILDDISNRFNLSMKTTVKLIELYGFVFLPKNYVDYVIDIPVYDDIMQHVELTELSYYMRESAKSMLNEILSEVSSISGQIKSESTFTVNLENDIRGMEKLLGLMANKAIVNKCISDFSFNESMSIYNKLYNEDVALQQEMKKVSIRAEEVQVEKPVKGKIGDYIESKLKIWFVEPVV